MVLCRILSLMAVDEGRVLEMCYPTRMDIRPLQTTILLNAALETTRNHLFDNRQTVPPPEDVHMDICQI